MPSIDTLGKRQQALLATLLEQRDGLSADELARQLGISRNATLQHLASFEKSGWIDSDLGDSTGGRPARRYRLTPDGQELFTRHYALMAKSLIAWIRKHHDTGAMVQCFAELGAAMAQPYVPRMAQYQGLPQKINELTSIMQELGYRTITQTNDDGASEIVAHNCVFHQLVGDCRQVCQFDLTMMGSLLDAKVELHSCIADNDRCCRFEIFPN